MKAILTAIFDSPLRHGAIPAHGGLAHFAAHQKVVSISTPDELNAAFVVRQDGGKGISYRGFQISKTATGEFFSTLDRDSWYETAAACRRAIDGFLKGRAA